MKKSFYLVILLIVIVNLIFLTSDNFLFAQEKSVVDNVEKVKENKPTKKYKEGEVIIKYKESKINLKKLSGQRVAASLEKEKDLEKKDELKKMNLRLLKSKTKTTKELIEELKNDPDVEYVEPNPIKYPTAIPNDLYFDDLWMLHNTGQTILGSPGTADADLDAPEAWDGESASNSEVVIAIVDTGVFYGHEDLAGNMWDGTGCVDENGDPIPGGCPNGGWNYRDNNDDPDDTDPVNSAHGTNVAGIAAAVTNNSKGAAGMSYQNKLKIMALPFDFNDGFSEVKAINFATENGAMVLNASFIGDVFFQSERDAIAAFPGIVSAAAGNNGWSHMPNGWDNDAANQQVYPCNYTLTNLICVAATDNTDAVPAFSNYGATSVDVGAPGVDTLNAWTPDPDSYAYLGGTSMSSPHVAGIAGMLYSKDPTLTQSEVRNAIINEGDSIPSLSGITVSGKRVNLNNSLASITLPPNAIPLYRFFSDKYKSQLYTESISERDNLIANWPTYIWEYQRIEFYGYDENEVSATPVYRFWSRKYNTHYYTTSSDERNNIIANWPEEIWKYDGLKFYVHTSSAAGRTSVYRFWSPKYKASYFTANPNQRDCMIGKYPENIWRYEGVSWWIPEQNSHNSDNVSRC